MNYLIWVVEVKYTTTVVQIMAQYTSVLAASLPRATSICGTRKDQTRNIRLLLVNKLS